MDKVTLAAGFAAGIVITVLFYIFLWKHRPYGRAKKVGDYAKQNGYVTKGLFARDKSRRFDLNMPRSMWNKDRSKVKYRYQVDGVEYSLWSRSEDIDNFQSEVDIYYDPEKPQRAYTRKQYAAAHNIRIWWMILFWIPLLILFYIGQALFS